MSSAYSMSEPASEKIEIKEIVLYTKVNIGFMTVDAAHHIIMRVEHPRHGSLDFHIAPEMAQAVAGWINLNLPGAKGAN